MIIALKVTSDEVVQAKQSSIINKMFSNSYKYRKVELRQQTKGDEITVILYLIHHSVLRSRSDKCCSRNLT